MLGSYHSYHHIFIMQAHSKLASTDDFDWYYSKGNDHPLPPHAPTDGTTQQTGGLGVRSGMWSHIPVSCCVNNGSRSYSTCWMG